MRMSKQTGVTLLELMVVLGIIGIFASIALPGYRDLISRVKVSDAIGETMTMMSLAYSESVKRGGQASLQINMNHPDFANAWVLVDTSIAAPVKDTVTGLDENIIAVIDIPTDIKLSFTTLDTSGTQVATTITEIDYSSEGVIDQSFDMTVCTQDPQQGIGSVIQLSLIGRPNVIQSRVDC